MQRALALMAALLVAALCEAQFSPVPSDARSASLGGCHVQQGEVRRVYAGYRQGYLLAGMATRTVGLDMPWGRRGRVEARYSHFGDRVYHEQRLQAAYSLAVSDRLSAGVGGAYCHLGTDDARYAGRHWLAFVARARASVGDGAAVYAAVGSRPWDGSRPVRGLVGVEYRAVESLLTVVEVDSDERVRLRCGAEYRYMGRYFLRAGMTTAPVVLSFGLGARLGGVDADLAVESHEYLGLTPQISLAWCF